LVNKLFCFQLVEILVHQSKISSLQHRFDYLPGGNRFYFVVHVRTVDLVPRGVVLPRDRVGVVICQPYVVLGKEEPFRWPEATKAHQLSVITKTLEIACSNPHGLDKTHFTIFPEYSICGLEGVTRVSDTLTTAAWPRQTIVIGGVDGLSKEQFAALCGMPGTHFDEESHSPALVQAHEWVNCQITWIKTEAGLVEQWVQPKIEPARPEQDGTCQQMFRGRSVYNFLGRFENAGPFRFSSLICFDWIGNVEGTKIWKSVLDQLQAEAQAANVQYTLSWFFVLQYNPSPSHNTFLAEIAPFFQQNSAPNINRAATCLVFANRAGAAKPAAVERFGQTSLVFCPQAQFARPKCSPTYSNGGMRFRNSDVLSGYHDVFFREGGACIYSFAQINPGEVIYGPAGGTHPVLQAKVFSVDDNHDYRAPSQPVPASVKWVNDQLDDLRLLSNLYPGLPLSLPSNETHSQNVSNFRRIEGRKQEQNIDLATCRVTTMDAEPLPTLVADQWDDDQLYALEHVVHSLNIISLGAPPVTVEADTAHASIILNGEPLDFIAVKGTRHEDCLKHHNLLLGSPKKKTLLITRDHDNTECSKRERSILDVEPRQLSDERRFDDPTRNLFHTGYDNILSIFRNATDIAEIPGALNAILNT
jgi:hypothetical protein